MIQIDVVTLLHLEDERGQETDVVDVLDMRPVAIVVPAIVPVTLDPLRASDDKTLTFGEFLYPAFEVAHLYPVSSATMQRNHKRGRFRNVLGHQ